jgi:hypothetical protein
MEKNEPFNGWRGKRGKAFSIFHLRLLIGDCQRRSLQAIANFKFQISNGKSKIYEVFGLKEGGPVLLSGETRTGPIFGGLTRKVVSVFPCHWVRGQGGKEACGD